MITALLIVCASPNIENYTTDWNKQDQQHLEIASKRCGQLYPDSPCVKTFRKKEEGTYAVICGAPSKEKTVTAKKDR